MKTPIIIGAIIALAAAGVWYATSASRSDAVAADGHHAGDDVKAFEVYPADVVERVERGDDVVLLDVRTPAEYAEVHLKGALLLPVQKLSAETLEAIGLGAEAKDREIIVYCRSGGRSETAYNVLTSLGYTNVKSIAGGMVHWEEDNYPLTETGPYRGALVSGESSVNGGAEKGARISLVRTFHDFGTIPQYGGVVEETFQVRNTGSAPLEIGELATSCSCTSARISSKRIAPGEEAELTVIFDPDFHEEPVGVFKRTVFIPTNDPTQPEVEVVIQVDIAEGE